MNASNHGWRAAAKAAAVPVAILVIVSLAADGASMLAGGKAGVAVIAVAFAACWLIGRRQARHPAPARRVAPGRDPQATAQVMLTESHEPARIAA